VWGRYLILLIPAGSGYFKRPQRTIKDLTVFKQIFDFLQKEFEARIVCYNNNQVFDFLIIMVYILKTRYWTFDNRDHQL